MSKVRNNLGKTTGWIHSSLQAGNVETINRAFRWWRISPLPTARRGSWSRSWNFCMKRCSNREERAMSSRSSESWLSFQGVVHHWRSLQSRRGGRKTCCRTRHKICLQDQGFGARKAHLQTRTRSFIVISMQPSIQKSSRSVLDLKTKEETYYMYLLMYSNNKVFKRTIGGFISVILFHWLTRPFSCTQVQQNIQLYQLFQCLWIGFFSRTCVPWHWPDRHHRNRIGFDRTWVVRPYATSSFRADLRS